MSDFLIENGTLIKYNGTASRVVIPDSVTAIGASAFEGCDTITQLVVPDTVREIGEDAFSLCGRLHQVKLGSGLRHIGASAFHTCSKLVKIALPEGLRTIGEHAFENCEHLRRITIPSTVTQIGPYLLAGCKRLTHVHIAAPLTTIPEGFCNDCSALQVITLPDTVTTLCDWAFESCASLRTIELPDGIRFVSDSAFSGCDRLEETIYGNGCYLGNARNPYLVYLHLEDGYTLDPIRVHPDTRVIAERAFDGGETTDVLLPKGLTTLPAGVFGYCPFLTTLALPEGLTEIRENAFCHCTQLTALTIPDTLTSCGKTAFSYCDALVLHAHAHLCEGVLSHERARAALGYLSPTDFVYTDADDAYFSAYIRENVTQLLPEIIGNSTRLQRLLALDLLENGYEEAIALATPLADVECSAMLLEWGNNHRALLERVRLAREEALFSPTEDTALWEWETLTEDTVRITGYKGDASHVVIPSTLAAKRVIGIAGYAFSPEKGGLLPHQRAFFTEQLTAVTIPPSVTTIEPCAFRACEALTELHITDLAAWCGMQMEDASYPFRASTLLYLNGTPLTELVIPAGVTRISSYVFRGYNALTSLVIPDSVTEIGEEAFSDCRGLTQVTLGDGLCTIGDGAFMDCRGLTAVTIPPSVTTIGHSAFCDCNSLARVTLPEGPLSIGDSAFLNCYCLQTMCIPVSVTRLGEYAFSGCSKLTEVTLAGSLTCLPESVFEFCQNLTRVVCHGDIAYIHEDAFAGCDKVTLYGKKGSELEAQAKKQHLRFM